jgi:hypothetical protein
MYYYTLNTFDRTLNVAPATLDISTPLYLPGQDYSGYGQAYDQNFLNLLQNFAGANSPTNPVTGTLWYDTENVDLKVWNSNSSSWIALSQTFVANSLLLFNGDVSGNGTVGNVVTLTLSQTSVIPGTYTSTNLTIGADGRILSASNGAVANSTTPVTSFNTRIGAITLNYTDVVNALGYIPINNTNTYYAVDANVVHKAGDTMTGDLNMSGTQIVTGLRAPSAPTDAVRFQEYSVALLPTTLLFDSGTVNNVVVNPSPSVGSYTTGLACRVKILNTNNGSSTLNINSLGTKNIVWNGVSLFPNSLVYGGIYDFCYDGASFQLLTTPSASGMITNNYLAPMPGKTIKGNNTGVASTPQDINFSSLFPSSFAQSGYTFLPNGCLIQWGKNTDFHTGQSSTTVTFPIPFPNICLIAVATAITDGNGGNDMWAQVVNTFTATTFQVYIQSSATGGDDNTYGFTWIAVGF